MPKEVLMQYKTIVLELLEQHPEMYSQLQSQRKLLEALERCSLELKISHEAWKDQLVQAKPGSDAMQISSEAMELAIQDLERRLFLEPLPEEDGPSLDGAMAFLRRHTRPA
jgi:hypothetical protein